MQTRSSGLSSWSQTIFKMVENIHPQKSAHVKYIVQTLGGMGDPSVQNTRTQLTTRLARLDRGRTEIASRTGRDHVEGSQAPDAVRSLRP